MATDAQIATLLTTKGTAPTTAYTAYNAVCASTLTAVCPATSCATAAIVGGTCIDVIPAPTTAPIYDGASMSTPVSTAATTAVVPDAINTAYCVNVGVAATPIIACGYYQPITGKATLPRYNAGANVTFVKLTWVN